MNRRLSEQASPYLQQHASNPVDWYPWGAEALDRAKRDDKPILLSIGYSACHWCHVMERESFEDAAIARLMNDWFVNIKVDREERPDLDQIYQLALQRTGRSGGWPLTMFLTPDQRPFYGGTYFPPVDRYGMPGWSKVLRAIREAYDSRRGEVEAHAAELTQAITQEALGGAMPGAGVGQPRVSPELVARAASKLAARFDDDHGGFGHRPKFPSTMLLDVLLRAGDVARVRKALDAMRAGGIWDQLAGGFHRYSTDERWAVPHFEKMLYDNALLLRLYVDGWRHTGVARYAGVARDIAAYVAREMTSPEGGFYAAQDADSEGEEGKFFVWTPRQVDQACGGDVQAADAAKRIWGITEEGNFERVGATVLSMAESPRDEGEAQALERARRAMGSARELRPKPFRDEKVLAGWNGLMISSLADAGAALGDPSLVQMATRAMQAIERLLVVREGSGRARLLRHAKGGTAVGTGFLEDHAFVADAALDLYEASASPHWVTLARAIADSILAHFYDRNGDDFFLAPDDGEALLVRSKDRSDHATPSGAAVASRVLLRLGSLVGAEYAPVAERTIERLAGAAVDSPFAMGAAVCVAARLARGSTEVALVGPPASEATRALARAACAAPLFDRVLGWVDVTDPSAIEACRELAQGKAPQPEPVAYVCRVRTCHAPLADPAALSRALATP